MKIKAVIRCPEYLKRGSGARIHGPCGQCDIDIGLPEQTQIRSMLPLDVFEVCRNRVADVSASVLKSVYVCEIYKCTGLCAAGAVQGIGPVRTGQSLCSKCGYRYPVYG